MRFNFFGQGSDPYDVSMCWPQYIDEAKRIVGEIRKYIATTKPVNPARAAELDEDLRQLIADHRNSNACPNISEGNHLYTFHTKELLDEAKEEADKAIASQLKASSAAAQPKKLTIKPVSKIAAQPVVVDRPMLSLPFKGGCPKTHFKATDAMGDFCKPCTPGQLFYNGKCQAKPGPCPCGLKRTGDPDFGPCPPTPSACPGPPPQNAKCNVPGHGLQNYVCKCGKWACPTNKDMLIAKLRREGKPVPPGLQGYGEFSYRKPLIGLAVLAGLAAAYYYVKRQG